MNLFLSPSIRHKLFDKTDYTSLTYNFAKSKYFVHSASLCMLRWMCVCICVFGLVRWEAGEIEGKNNLPLVHKCPSSLGVRTYSKRTHSLMFRSPYIVMVQCFKAIPSSRHFSSRENILFTFIALCLLQRLPPRVCWVNVCWMNKCKKACIGKSLKI